jgi:hypothetical protein
MEEQGNEETKMPNNKGSWIKRERERNAFSWASGLLFESSFQFQKQIRAPSQRLRLARLFARSNATRRLLRLANFAPRLRAPTISLNSRHRTDADIYSVPGQPQAQPGGRQGKGGALILFAVARSSLPSDK